MKAYIKSRVIGTILFLMTIAIGFSAVAYRKNFLNSGVDISIGATLVNGIGFASNEIACDYRLDRPTIGTLSVTFTRSAGSSSTVDFEFQSSDGSVWTTAYYVCIQVETQETAISNVVRVTKPVYIQGISHLRLYRIVNNDGTNALTACNATLSY